MELNAYATSGSSPGKTEPDLVCENHFTLFLLFPLTDCAKTWVEENLPSDYFTFGMGIVIEARYFWAIFEGIQNDGLVAVPR